MCSCSCPTRVRAHARARVHAAIVSVGVNVRGHDNAHTTYGNHEYLICEYVRECGRIALVRYSDTDKILIDEH